MCEGKSDMRWLCDAFFAEERKEEDRHTQAPDILQDWDSKGRFWQKCRDLPFFYVFL